MASLVEAGYLRKRTRGWFWTRRDRAADLADIRSSGGNPVRIVETRPVGWSGRSTRRRPTPPCTPAPSTCTSGETYLVELVRP